jgi:TRAP-type C4-dicarboxylate transport system permease small subunit
MLLPLLQIITNLGEKLDADNPGFWDQTNPSGMVQNVITTLLIIAVVALVLLLLYGGFRWVTSAGDKEKLSAAQRTITSALIGIAVVFSTWGVYALIKSFFKLPDDLTGDFDVNPSGSFANLANIGPSGLVSLVISLLLTGTVVVSFLFFLFGGFQWVTSGGDKEKVTQAQRRITHALIGLAVAFSTWAIFKLVQSTFRLPDLFQLSIP